MIHAKISGSGNPILLIHGFCETSDIWTSLETQISINYQVISIDLPGFGKSSLNSTIESLDDIACEISKFLHSKNITQCFVIGHSLGGYIAMSLARNYPRQLLGFGLFHSTTFADDEEKKKIRDKTVEFVENHGIELWAKGFISKLFYFKNTPNHKKDILWLEKMASKTPLEVFKVYTTFMKSRSGSTELLRSFKKPVFFISGENDVVVPMSQSLLVRDQITNGDSLILAETGHMGFIEKPEECFLFIKSFLQENRL